MLDPVFPATRTGTVVQARRRESAPASPSPADQDTAVRAAAGKQTGRSERPGQVAPLAGDRVGYWAMRVPRNWRIVFRFEDGDVWDVDLVDYH